MQSSSSSLRIATMIRLMGVALSIVGLFLPMFIGSNPQVSGSAHPIYEWQTVSIADGFPIFAVLFRVAFALPIVAILILLVASCAEVFGQSSPRFALLRRIVAGWGLGIQLLFDIAVFLLYLIGYSRTDIAWGFVVVLIGFIVSVINTTANDLLDYYSRSDWGLKT